MYTLLLILLISFSLGLTTYDDAYEKVLVDGLNLKRGILSAAENANSMFHVSWCNDFKIKALEKVKKCERKKDDDLDFFSIYDTDLSKFPVYSQETFDNKDNDRGFNRFAKWDMEKLGCAYEFCDKMTGDEEKSNIYLLGCYFKFKTTPTSQDDFTNPYEKGVVCSKCVDYGRVCQDSLCA